MAINNSVGLFQTRQNQQSGQSEQRVLADKTLFLSYRKSTRALLILAIVFPILAIALSIMSIVVVFIGKDKDKIVFLDVSGRPALVRVDDPDVIYLPELEVFLKDAMPEIFGWDYAEIRNDEEFKKHAGRMQVLFDGNFFKGFFGPFKEIYLRSVVGSRLVVKASYGTTIDLKKSKGAVRIVCEIRLRTIRVGEATSVGEADQVKKYEMGVVKSVRGLANPFGLYINYFRELNTDAVQ